MRIERVEVRHLAIPFKHHFTTSFSATTEHHTVILRAYSDGLVGYGEATPFYGPVYCSETTDSVLCMLRDFILPGVIGKDFADAEALMAALSWIRGNQFAKSAVEIAFQDLLAQAKGVPLHEHLGGTQTEIPVGVSIGIQDTLQELLDQIEAFRGEGYERIKIKIKPGWDVDIVAAVRRAYPDLMLMVDANSAYTLADTEHLRRLDDYDLLMIEQPLGYDDIVDHASLQQRLHTPICLDESIHSPDDARKAIDLGSCRIINIKPGRVGGYLNSIRIHDICVAHHIGLWIGCMLETGIGQARKIELASLPGFTLPADMAPSNRYYVEDVVEPEILLTPRSTIVVSNTVGGSHRPVEARIAKYTRRSFTL
ncbi:MAG: o-succinylbenzoate synthase [Chloroflexi bacterium]|nr:o-succinylbenzoate synthase [Chloroflexota bacterium]